VALGAKWEHAFFVRSALWIVLVCACGTSPHDTPSSRSTWVVVDGSKTDYRDRVAIEARDASAKGLVPVLYLSAGYTLASAELQKLSGSAPMQEALAGIEVIDVDPVSTDDPLFTGFRHSFHSLDERGQLTGRVLDPGTKNGPCTDGNATSCATWIRRFMRLERDAQSHAP
jgi:hypothetical protein